MRNELDIYRGKLRRSPRRLSQVLHPETGSHQKHSSCHIDWMEKSCSRYATVRRHRSRRTARYLCHRNSATSYVYSQPGSIVAAACGRHVATNDPQCGRAWRQVLFLPPLALSPPSPSTRPHLPLLLQETKVSARTGSARGTKRMSLLVQQPLPLVSYGYDEGPISRPAACL